MFNYGCGYIYGLEFSVDYSDGLFSVYFNVVYNKVIGIKVIIGQYNFDLDVLVYVVNYWIYFDYDQKLILLGGFSYVFVGYNWVGVNYVFGSGLCLDIEGVFNGGELLVYLQVNFSVGYDFNVDSGYLLYVQLVVINVLDCSY